MAEQVSKQERTLTCMQFAAVKDCTYVRMPYALASATASQSDMVKHGYIVSHNCCLTNDHTSSMVNEYARAQLGRRMYVYVQHL